MPDPLMIRDNPWFMQDMHAYGGDQSLNAPDPALLNREDDEMMKVVMAMLGPTGYIDYINKLKQQRKDAGTKAFARPGAPPKPPQPSPTPANNIKDGLAVVGGKTQREKELEQMQKEYGI